MEYKMKKLIIAGALFVVGCASNSGVIPIGQDTFMVSRQAATGFSGSGTLKAEAFQEANQFCSKIGKSLQVISTYEASPPFIIANFPKAEIQFMCLDAKDAELNRPKLKKNADTVIELKQDTRVQDSGDMYMELKKLKDLLDTGIITQEEFDAQKKKIIAK
jgi:hypothetical protein